MGVLGGAGMFVCSFDVFGVGRGWDGGVGDLWGFGDAKGSWRKS